MEWLIVGAIFGFIGGHMLGKRDRNIFDELRVREGFLKGRLEALNEVLDIVHNRPPNED